MKAKNLTEREALSSYFTDLQDEKKQLTKTYKIELAGIEKRLENTLQRLKELDEMDAKREAAAAKEAAAQAVDVKEESKIIAAVDQLHGKFMLFQRDVKNRIDEMKTSTDKLGKKVESSTLPQPLPPIAAELPQEAPQPQKVLKLAETPESPEKEPAAAILSTDETAESKETLDPDTREDLATGQKLYKLYYRCTSSRCGNKGKRFVPQSFIHTFCGGCGKQLKIKPATKAGFPNKDVFGNYFIAGNQTLAEEWTPEQIEIVMKGGTAAAHATASAGKIDSLLENYNKERENNEQGKNNLQQEAATV